MPLPITTEASRMFADFKKKATSAASAAKGKLDAAAAAIGKEAGVGPSSGSGGSQDALQQMVDMGVPRAEAAAALEATGGEVEAAIAMLYADDAPRPNGVGSLMPGKRAIVSGLQSAPELNGLSVTLEHFDAGAGRWRVRFDDGEAKALKPANLDAAPCGPASTASGREPWDVPFEAVAIKSGVWVKVHGLESASGKPLNGKIGQVIEHDARTGRILVDINDEPKLLKAENLKKASTTDEAKAQMRASFKGAKASAQDMKRRVEVFMKSGSMSKKDGYEATTPLTGGGQSLPPDAAGETVMGRPLGQPTAGSSSPAPGASAASTAAARRAAAEAAERRLAEARARNAGTMDDWRRMRSGVDRRVPVAPARDHSARTAAGPRAPVSAGAARSDSGGGGAAEDEADELEVLRRAQAGLLRQSVARQPQPLQQQQQHGRQHATTQAQTQTADVVDMDEDEDLQRALAMSLDEAASLSALKAAEAAQTSPQESAAAAAAAATAPAAAAAAEAPLEKQPLPAPGLPAAAAAAADDEAAFPASTLVNSPRSVMANAPDRSGFEAAVAEDPELFELMLQQTMAEEELELQKVLAESLLAERKALEEVTVDPNSSACCAATGNELEQQLHDRRAMEQRAQEERAALEANLANLREKVARRESGLDVLPDDDDDEGVAEGMASAAIVAVSSSSAVQTEEGASAAAADDAPSAAASAAAFAEPPTGAGESPGEGTAVAAADVAAASPASAGSRPGAKFEDQAEKPTNEEPQVSTLQAPTDVPAPVAAEGVDGRATSAVATPAAAAATPAAEAAEPPSAQDAVLKFAPAPRQTVSKDGPAAAECAGDQPTNDGGDGKPIMASAGAPPAADSAGAAVDGAGDQLANDGGDGKPIIASKDALTAVDSAGSAMDGAGDQPASDDGDSKPAVASEDAPAAAGSAGDQPEPDDGDSNTAVACEDTPAAEVSPAPAAAAAAATTASTCVEGSTVEEEFAPAPAPAAPARCSDADSFEVAAQAAADARSATASGAKDPGVGAAAADAGGELQEEARPPAPDIGVQDAKADIVSGGDAPVDEPVDKDGGHPAGARSEDR